MRHDLWRSRQGINYEMAWRASMCSRHATGHGIWPLDKLNRRNMIAWHFPGWIRRVLTLREAVRQHVFHTCQRLIWLQTEPIVPLDMKGCICHCKKWQIHPFISKGTQCANVWFDCKQNQCVHLVKRGPLFRVKPDKRVRARHVMTLCQASYVAKKKVDREKKPAR